MKNGKKLIFPLRATFAITGRCNLRCLYCCSASSWAAEKNNELTLDEIKSLLDYFASEKIMNLFIYGGEPFCHQNIIEILRYVSRYRINLRISTNGTLINQEIAKEIRRIGNNMAIQVSLEGHSSDMHDSVRGVGSFEKAINGINCLRAENIPVIIRATITKFNYKYISEMRKYFLDELKSKMISFENLLVSGEALNNADKLKLSENQTWDVFTQIWQIMNDKKAIGISGNGYVKVAKIMKNYIEAAPKSGGKGRFGRCGMNYDVIAVRADGKIVPCANFWDYPIGDIRKERIKDVWLQDKGLKPYNNISEMKLVEYEKCAKCDYRTFCNGGCRARAFYDTGEIDGKDQALCEIFGGKKERLIERYKDAIKR